jgi:hypothetical protein
MKRVPAPLPGIWPCTGTLPGIHREFISYENASGIFIRRACCEMHHYCFIALCPGHISILPYQRPGSFARSGCIQERWRKGVRQETSAQCPVQPVENPCRRARDIAERAGPPARSSPPDNQIFYRIGKNAVYLSFFGSMIISQKLSPLHMAREIRIW